MSKEGKNGVTAKTPQNILFGAGTIHKGLTYSESTGWNFAATLCGATSGGSKLTITPEITPIEIDGVLVRAKGLEVKTGEVAQMEVNFIELSKELIKSATLGKLGTSADADFDLIESKPDIETGDYWTNIAFVGKTVTGDNVIAILPDAICISGMEQDGKNKEGSVGTYTFACSAELTSDLDALPWKIYYPKQT